MEAASNLLENSSHQLGGGIFDPTGFVLEFLWQPFSSGGRGRVLYLQRERIIISLEVTLGQRWKKGAQSPYLWLLICQPRVEMLCPWAFNV